MVIAIIRTVILYAFVILAVRLMGKRQISEMQPSELVITLIISDIASIPMQNTSQPLLSGVIPVIILVACEIAASLLMMKSNRFRNIICGMPVIVIDDGKLLQSQMKRLRMTTEDLCEQLRQQDIFSIEDVQYCIVETNGRLSVLEKPEKRGVTLEDMNIGAEDSKLEAVVINDGKILKNSLKVSGRTQRDIDRILRKEKKEVKDIFIMTLDGNGNYYIAEKEKS